MSTYSYSQRGRTSSVYPSARGRSRRVIVPTHNDLQRQRNASLIRNEDERCDCGRSIRMLLNRNRSRKSRSQKKSLKPSVGKPTRSRSVSRSKKDVSGKTELHRESLQRNRSKSRSNNSQSVSTRFLDGQSLSQASTRSQSGSSSVAKRKLSKLPKKSTSRHQSLSKSTRSQSKSRQNSNEKDFICSSCRETMTRLYPRQSRSKKRNVTPASRSASEGSTVPIATYGNRSKSSKKPLKAQKKSLENSHSESNSSCRDEGKNWCVLRPAKSQRKNKSTSCKRDDQVQWIITNNNVASGGRTSSNVVKSKDRAIQFI